MKTSSDKLGKLVLIDGHSILTRAYFGVPDLTNAEGLHTNAVYGFLNIVLKILEEEQADHLAVAFDLKEPTFRHKMFEAYKGTRNPMPADLHQQVELMKDVLKAMNVPILTKAGYEADDILGTIAKRGAREGFEVVVVSGDRDLLQLSDTSIKIRIPKTSKGTTQIKDYYPEDVQAEYQVTPQEFIDVKALMGDSSDNIPGVPSIGEKTATAIISIYKSIENAYAHLEEIKPPRAKKALEEHFELAKLSKELATICIDCDIDFTFEGAKVDNLYTPEALEYMKRLEFKSLISRFHVDTLETSSTEDSFIITSDKEIFKKAIKDAMSCNLIAFQLVVEREEILAFSFCSEKERAYCFFPEEDLQKEDFIKAAKEFCKSGKEIWVMDLKSQLPFLNLFYETNLFDASVGAYLLNPLKNTYDYDDLSKDHLGLFVPSKEELFGANTYGKYLKEKREKVGHGIAYIAYTVFACSNILKEKLEESGMASLFEEIEMPLIYSLYHMEQEGIQVEKERLKEYSEVLKIKIDKIEQEIYEQTHVTFNINSPKQLGEVLFGQMELPHGKKTKTGYSTSAEVLEKLAPEYPVIQLILEYRQLTKLNSTYAEGLAAFIQEDGRIHGKFNQTITATGRISSTEPNLQNIPIRMELGREIRKIFVPKDGFVFIDADYSQIELRILAHMSEDIRLIDAYNHAEDIHAITASQVFHTPLEEVTDLQRRNAKAVNFGIVYGISAFGLSEDLSISRKEATQYIETYFQTYPQVKEFLDQLVEQGRELGYVSTMFGRRRPVPELNAGNFMQRAAGERVAMNSPIQGTAADIIKIAMIRVDQELRKQDMESRIVLQVHDELLIEAKKDEVEVVKSILETQMKQAAQLKVVLEVDASVGQSWFDAK